MWWTLLVTLACSGPPDPDARLRAGDLEGAAAAWATQHGAPLDVDHPVAQVLALRAPRDPSITTASLADAVAAVRFLEQAPLKRTEPLDLSFGKMVDLGAALDALAEPPALVVVGRSENLADRDPFTPGAALPWKGGRLVEYVRADAGTPPGAFEALGARIDADPPVKLVTLGFRDASGDLYVKVEHRDGAWWPIGASDARAAARLVLAAEAVRDYGGATLRAREGGGLVRR